MKNTVSFIWFWSGFWLAVLFYQTFRHGSFCLLIGCGFLRFVKVNFGQGEIHVSISKNWVYLHDHELPPCQLVAWGFYRPYCHLVAGRFSMVAMCLHHIIQGVIALSCNWQGVTLLNGKVLLSTLSNGKVLLSQILHYFFYKIVFKVMKIVKSMQNKREPNTPLKLEAIRLLQTA